MIKRTGIRKKVKRTNYLPRYVELEFFSRRQGIDFKKTKQINSICKRNGTAIEKIPAWLLSKDAKRIEYWFKTGE